MHDIAPPPSQNEAPTSQIERLRKAEHALAIMAEHCRQLCDLVSRIEPEKAETKGEKAKPTTGKTWPSLEKDTALSQKILGLIGSLLTQEKRLQALLPREQAKPEPEDAIDWTMLEEYFHRRGHEENHS